MYEWAYDAAGQPVHIYGAARSETYFCPVCGGRMIARLGDVKQHHFAHESLQFCEPSEVARAAAARWLVNRLQACLKDERGVMITWQCPLCHQPHTTNLLKEVTEIRQDYTHADGLESDVALLDATGKVRGVLLVSKPSSDALVTYTAHEIVVIVVDAARGRFTDLPSLLAGARLIGGMCTTQKSAAQTGIISEVSDLRQVLIDAVSRPPYNIYGPLQQLDELTHVFTLGDKKLWLPPILWQRAIGGLLHTINPALQVITQEWQQTDGATIALYYITARSTYAIAVRRFAPGQQVYARLDTAAFRSDRETAARDRPQFRRIIRQEF